MAGECESGAEGGSAMKLFLSNVKQRWRERRPLRLSRSQVWAKLRREHQ